MKILMISYPFPPYGGMSQRTVYFANYLVKQGHHVDVIAANPSKYFHGYDAGLTGLISKEVNVHRTYAGVFHHLRYRAKRAFSNTRKQGSNAQVRIYNKIENLIAPVSTLEWLPWGFVYGFRLCLKNKYDVIYSHGDPYIANLAGYLLKKSFKIPLVIYIGDPRYFGVYSRFKKILKHLENLCLSEADSVIVNCPETLNGYLHHFPGMDGGKFTVITDGFDENRYKDIPAEASDKFRIVYTGVFYDFSREPFELFKALMNFKEDEIEVVVAGDVSSRYKEFVKNNGLDGTVSFLGHQPHSRAISLQKGATVLLLIGWSGGYQVPGKLFEYFAAKKPIMVIQYDNKDIASGFVKQYNRGVIAGNRADEISDIIRSLYNRWKEKRLDSSFNLDELNEFTWEKLSQELERVFKSVARDNKEGKNV